MAVAVSQTLVWARVTSECSTDIDLHCQMMNKGFQLLTDHIEITQGGTSTPREKPLPLGVRKKRGKTKGTVVPPKKCVQY